MQRHEVRLHGAESWGGGGWGRTASAPPCGRVRAVWRRCPVPATRATGGDIATALRCAGALGSTEHADAELRGKGTLDSRSGYAPDRITV